ncbi:MAG: glycosyltransferase [Beijerinckiaceae bacterium]|nr:glycosyltransferase [Beijerinckiaceae bacterium]
MKEKYDLFFYACSFVHDLSNLDNIHGWEECSRFRVAFIMESWSNLLKDQKGYMKYLDRFDHLFLLNASSIPNLQKMTRAPCTFLPLAADCVAASPFPHLPARSIDVYSMGRRAPAVHRQLSEAMQKNDLLYLFDTTHSGVVIDWAESRQMTADLIKRSKYFVTFDHTIGSALKAREASGEVALSMRYFEGAAGGAVMIGSKPKCAEFRECFDWPDSVLEIPEHPEDIIEILKEFDSDAERLNGIRRTNVMESHLRHDWSHRWQEVLEVCGLPSTSAIAERQSLLTGWANSMQKDTAARSP